MFNRHKIYLNSSNCEEKKKAHTFSLLCHMETTRRRKVEKRELKDQGKGRTRKIGERKKIDAEQRNNCRTGAEKL